MVQTHFRYSKDRGTNDSACSVVNTRQSVSLNTFAVVEPSRSRRKRPACVDIMIRSNLCFFAVCAITSAASPLRSRRRDFAARTSDSRKSSSCGAQDSSVPSRCHRTSPQPVSQRSYGQAGGRKINRKQYASNHLIIAGTLPTTPRPSKPPLQRIELGAASVAELPQRVFAIHCRICICSGVRFGCS
jgi:hypothetical protein